MGRALRALLLLLILAWLPALWLWDRASLWPALAATWRLALFVLLARWLTAGATPHELAACLDRALACAGVRLELAAALPLAGERFELLRDRLQGALFSLALRSGARRRNPCWWAAQAPRIVALLLLTCEYEPAAAPPAARDRRPPPQS